MKDDGIEVARVRWGELPDGTETSWIKLIELPNGDLLIVQHDMGSETLASFDRYDIEQFIQIASADRAQFTAMLLSLAIEGTTSCNWDDLQRHCSDWDVLFQASGRAIS